MPTLSFLNNPDTDLIRQLLHLYRQAGWWEVEAPDDADHVARIIAGSHCFAIAEQGDKIVGMGRAISDRASDAYIQDVTVTEEYRGQNIGARIISMLVERLQADGISWIGLIAEQGSEPLYTKNNFARMKGCTPFLHSKDEI